MSDAKRLRAKELLGQDTEELQGQLKRLEQELFQNRLKQMTNQLENTMVIRNARRNIARLETVLTQKLRDQKKGSAAGGQQQPEGKGNP